MDILNKVRETIQRYSMLSGRENVLIGLSGGPDSVCLLTILYKLRSDLNINLYAAYIDHGLRPAETPAEIEFCRELCNSKRIMFLTKAVDVKAYAKKNGLNKQEAARELRYKALNEIAHETGASKIALGHNADDQAETVLMRLIRGAGHSGLAGIPPVRNQKAAAIIRPLIEIERKEIEEFIEKEGAGFIVDSSNLGDEYLRNKLRSFIMPSLKKTNPDFIKTVLRTSDIFRDEERYFEVIVTKTLMKLIANKTGKTIELFLVPLETMDTVILRRVLRKAIDETSGLRGISFIHIEDIIKLIKKGKSGDRIYLPKNVRAIKGYSTMVITSEEPKRLGIYVMDAPGEIILKESSMIINSEIINNTELDDYRNGKETALIDADKANFPLIIRGRQSGDYFYPYGFGKRKKLQDYFVDEKIPRDERDTVPILTHNNNIVWVIGHRLDDRCRIDKSTKRILKLKLQPLKFKNGG
ncbi:MAG: tRNA lysidine(34) synthetase TilS [Thermodesulfovibrionales bacterium]|nr:tRNA lysidine(34) synthetase TilS [Thermodesulfovibrionales bacterium]